MSIACVAGAERGGKRVEIIRQGEQRARSAKGIKRARLLPGHCFRRIYFCQNRDWSELLAFPFNNQTGSVCMDRERSRPCQMQRLRS